MTSTIAVTVSLCCLLVPAFTAAAERTPVVGERCDLHRPAVLTSKRSGKGKKSPIAVGATLEVVAIERGMLLVTSGPNRGYISKKGYVDYCRVVAASQETNATSPTPAVKAESSEGAVGTPPAAFGATTKTKVAVMDLRGTSDLPKEVVTSLTATIAETLESLGAFKAISTADIQQVLSYEATRQMLGCDDVSCIAEIGGALGADYLVTGSITRVGDLYVTQLQLTRIAETRVDARVSRDFRGDRQGLFDEVRTAARMLVRDLLDQRAGELRLSVSEEGATIKVDGRIVGSSPLAPTQVAGGVHTLTIEKQGFVVAKQDFEIGAGKPTEVTVALVPSAEFVRDYRSATGRVRTLAWGSLAGGAAGSIGAVVLYVLAGRAADDLNDRVEAYNDGAARSTAEYERLGDRQKRVAMLDVSTIVSGGVGIVGLGLGTALLLFGDAPDRYDAGPTGSASGAQVSVSPLAGGYRLSLGGRF